MEEATFRAMVLDDRDGVQAEIKHLSTGDLPDGDVLVRVAYSDLNYKDGLAVTGRGRVVRRYPMVPGIDLAGTVEESSSPRYKPGDAVIATGWGLAEQHWGGYTGRERLQADWLVPLPEGMSAKTAMALGTAGLTAMLAVMALEQNGLSAGREVVVTGATGGVGSVAVALLAQLGHRVIASTGDTDMHDYLKGLGAADIISRDVFSQPPKRPLDSERWGGAVDTVGGSTVAGLLPGMAKHTSIAACGNAGGAAFETTVFPFILRGVNLLGIDSNYCPTERRIEAWERLARELPADLLDGISRVVPLDDVQQVARDIVEGKINGRVVVDVNAK